ncbi:MAG: ATP-binding cassette domain-containing protein [Spirochaetia bacterium]|jgi:tungstate transport system ATP-binding protein
MSSTGAAPLFALRGLCASLDGRAVVTVESLDIEEGEVTVLVGENGSGKTTLLRLLNGLIAPAKGCIEFRGKSVGAEGLADVRRDTVLVHQSPLLFRGTVGLNVGYGLRIRGMRRAEAAAVASASLRRVGLPGFERRRASALSGGEKQRVALARALALSPRVLLLDEPTANVDEQSRRELEAIIRDVSASGTTVIMSTHNRELAYRLCDRLVRLDAGVPEEAEENILKGGIERIDEQFAYFRTGGALLRCPARQGDFAVAVLACDELILSRKPLDSSARNQLTGIVTEMRPSGSLLTAVVDCGVPLRALITREAAAEIGVAPGAACVVTFKASAVRLY